MGTYGAPTWTFPKFNMAQMSNEQYKGLMETKGLVKLTATAIWNVSVISIYIAGWKVSRCWAWCFGVAENPIGSLLDITTLMHNKTRVALQHG